MSLTSVPDEAVVALQPLGTARPESTGKLSLPLVRALRTRVRSFRPNLLLAYGGSTLRYGVLATRGFDMRLAYVAIGEPEYWIKSRLSCSVNRALLRRTDVVLAVAQRTLEQLIALEPSLIDRVFVAPTGIPEDLFKLPHESHRGPLRAVMVGSLSMEKDPVTALRALARSDGTVLRLVGSGPLLTDLRIEADRLGVSDRIDFTGAVNDITPHLEWADVLLLTSLTEGLPGVVLEAGAAGLPTVAVNVGGVSEAVLDGRTGYVVDHSVTSVAEAIASLQRDRVRLREMGSAARAHIASAFDLASTTDRISDILLSTVR